MGRRLLGALLGAFCAAGAASAQADRSPDEVPMGLWSWSVDEPPASHTLAVVRTPAGWRADLDSVAAPATHIEGVLAVEGPDGSRFVGEAGPDRSPIRGYWYQPSTSLHYQAVATPTVLSAVGEGRWRGDIAPQPRPYRVFLEIFEGPDDQVLAVIRNPEGNDILGATRFRVVPEGEGEWSLVAGSGDRERRYGLTRSTAGGLLLAHRRFDDPIPLQAATDTLAVGYYSRLDHERPDRFAPPPQLDDGWAVALPEEAGFDRAALHALTEELASADPRSRRPEMIHSLLVWPRGGSPNTGGPRTTYGAVSPDLPGGVPERRASRAEPSILKSSP